MRCLAAGHDGHRGAPAGRQFGRRAPADQRRMVDLEVIRVVVAAIAAGRPRAASSNVLRVDEVLAIAHAHQQRRGDVGERAGALTSRPVRRVGGGDPVVEVPPGGSVEFQPASAPATVDHQPCCPAPRRSARSGAAPRPARSASSTMAGVNRSGAARPRTAGGSGPCTIGHCTTAAASRSARRRPARTFIPPRLVPHSPTRPASIAGRVARHTPRRCHVGALSPQSKYVAGVRRRRHRYCDSRMPALRSRGGEVLLVLRKHHVVRRAEAVHQHDGRVRPAPGGSVSQAAQRVPPERKSTRSVGMVVGMAISS